MCNSAEYPNTCRLFANETNRASPTANDHWMPWVGAAVHGTVEAFNELLIRPESPVAADIVDTLNLNLGDNYFMFVISFDRLIRGEPYGRDAYQKKLSKRREESVYEQIAWAAGAGFVMWSGAYGSLDFPYADVHSHGLDALQKGTLQNLFFNDGGSTHKHIVLGGLFGLLRYYIPQWGNPILAKGDSDESLAANFISDVLFEGLWDYLRGTLVALIEVRKDDWVLSGPMAALSGLPTSLFRNLYWGPRYDYPHKNELKEAGRKLGLDLDPLVDRAMFRKPLFDIADDTTLALAGGRNIALLSPLSDLRWSFVSGEGEEFALTHKQLSIAKTIHELGHHVQVFGAKTLGGQAVGGEGYWNHLLNSRNLEISPNLLEFGYICDQVLEAGIWTICGHH